MGFQDAGFLPSRAGCSTTFLRHCGMGESLVTTTCLERCGWGKQGHAPCKVRSLPHILLFVSVSFCEDHETKCVIF